MDLVATFDVLNQNVSDLMRTAEDLLLKGLSNNGVAPSISFRTLRRSMGEKFESENEKKSSWRVASSAGLSKNMENFTVLRDRTL